MVQYYTSSVLLTNFMIWLLLLNSFPLRLFLFLYKWNCLYKWKKLKTSRETGFLYTVLVFLQIVLWSENKITDTKTNYTNCNKQIFHAFLFNIRNYSPEVINIERREVELNIILPTVNNFDIKQKRAWNICINICHQQQTRSGKIKTNKKQQILVKTQSLF